MNIIEHPIKPDKGKAWHLYMHPYFTKQASNVVSAYIENFTIEGDTVLDPFCGTGVSAIEALAKRRKAIVFDINPLACFITEQTVAQIDTNKFIKAFTNIEDKVGKKIKNIDSLSGDKVNKKKLKYWYPKGIKLPKNTDAGYDFVEQLWTKGQLLSLSILWNEINQIEDIDIKNQMKLVFSATISRVNITYNLSMSRQKGNKINIGDGGAAIFAQYRYWFPKKIIEIKVWENFERRFKLILKGKVQWNKLTEGFSVKDNFLCINDSVLNLSKHIPEGTIDYIYTDPPYGGNIAYLDLSTMWNAWLGFDIKNEMRKDEIIEGGNLDKSQQNYEELLSKSFKEMSKSLKKDGWLSLVFAHKKLEFWNLIIDSNQDNGMEFKGSVYQPTNNSSVHYKRNPANVLCSQRIANFQKTYEILAREKPDDLKIYILNEIERACIEHNGAEIDIIYQRVLDKLLNNNTIHEAKKKGFLKLDQILDNENIFVFDPNTNKYYVKDPDKKHDIYEKDYFSQLDELMIFVRSLLKEKKGMKLDDIHKEIFEIYKDDKKFPVDKLHKDLTNILNEIAYKNKKTNQWLLKPDQIAFDFGKVISDKLVKVNAGMRTHSEIIFRLVQIGNYLGFKSWIGKREQTVDSFMGYKFKDISVKDLPINTDDKFKRDRIKQIDVIWIDKLSNPRYAFEVEESTTIISGFERFMKLLEVNHDLSKKIFIVAPSSRRRKIEDSFKKSTYIGAPLYLENKVGLIIKEEIVEFYDNHIDVDFEEYEFINLSKNFVL